MAVFLNSCFAKEQTKYWGMFGIHVKNGFHRGVKCHRLSWRDVDMGCVCVFINTGVLRGVGVVLTYTNIIIFLTEKYFRWTGKGRDLYVIPSSLTRS